MKIDIPKSLIHLGNNEIRCICRPKKKNGQLADKGKLLCNSLKGNNWELIFTCPGCKRKIIMESDLGMAVIEDNQQSPYIIE